MLARLALLFIAVPLLELVVLIQLGQMIGLWPTVGLVVLTGATGAALARAQGLRTLWRFQESTRRGELPTEAIQHGLAILVGAALLLTPGILTDLVGFALLLPPTRRWVVTRIRRWIGKRIEEGRLEMAVVFPRPPHADSEVRLDPDREIRVE